MTKRELIDQITHLNPTATAGFLAEFATADLAEYLEHLQWTHPSGDSPFDAEEEPARPPSADDGPVRLAG